MKHVQVLNKGAGVQTTTITEMLLRGLIRWCDLDRGTDPERAKQWAGNEEPIKMDVAIFADTGEEPSDVYENVLYFQTLKNAPPVFIRSVSEARNIVFRKMDGITDVKRLGPLWLEVNAIEQGRLGNDLQKGINSTGQRFAAIPAFTTTRESVPGGRTKRQCTKEYKSEVVERSIRRDVLGLAPRKRIPKDVIVHQFFGLSFEEPRRVFGKAGKPGVKARVEFSRQKMAHFPLFDLFLTRSLCVEWLKKFCGDRKVTRSACVFCPFKSNREWRELRDNDPVAWLRAVAIDHALRTTGSVANRDMDQIMYVHRSCMPLDKANIDTPDDAMKQTDLNFFGEEECEGFCGN